MTPTEEPTEVMTLAEVANLLRCHSSTLYRMAKRGDIPSWRLGSDYRFTRAEVLEWIGKQRRNGR